MSTTLSATCPSPQPGADATAAPLPRGRIGRPPATGRFATRAELLDRVWFLQGKTNLSLERIAKNVCISQTAVAAIIRRQEGRPEAADVAPGLPDATDASAEDAAAGVDERDQRDERDERPRGG